MELVFAGNFMTDEEQDEFDRLLQKPEFADAVKHLGFVSGAEKPASCARPIYSVFPRNTSVKTSR